MNPPSTLRSLASRMWNRLSPPSNWVAPVIVLLGIATGMLFYIAYISNAVSYMSDDPQTCINCHVMYPQFSTWEKSSHGRVATCNDCHVPQDNIFKTYFFKASDGLRHATMFTLRMEPQVIRIKAAGKQAVQDNCIRCHSNHIHPIALRSIDARAIVAPQERFCWDCHRQTPHGRVHSLASTPNSLSPRLAPLTPAWMRNLNSNSD